MGSVMVVDGLELSLSSPADAGTVSGRHSGAAFLMLTAFDLSYLHLCRLPSDASGGRVVLRAFIALGIRLLRRRSQTKSVSARSSSARRRAMPDGRDHEGIVCHGRHCETYIAKSCPRLRLEPLDVKRTGACLPSRDGRQGSKSRFRHPLAISGWETRLPGAHRSRALIQRRHDLVAQAPSHPAHVPRQ